jgi:hypothetical protein
MRFFLNFILTCTTIIILFACDQQKTVKTLKIERTLSNLIVQNDTGKIYKLDKLIDNDWEKLIILEPYFDRASIQDELDLVIPSTNIETTEGPNVYLLLKNKKVVEYFQFSYNAEYGIVLNFDKNLILRSKRGTYNFVDFDSTLKIKLLPNYDTTWKGGEFRVFK